MGLIRFLSITILAGVCAVPMAHGSETEYHNYVEGAMKVYMQFQEPSVQESNKFLSFVNSRWQSVDKACISDCSTTGQKAAQEYANVFKVKLTDGI